MSLFKNIRIELLVLLIISLNVFISFNLDLGLYNYFKDFNKNPNNVYLKEFFEDITRLGSSSWYFSISIIGFGIVYLNKRLGFIKIEKQKKISNFFVSSFVYILVVGIVTQVLKHIVGRPRPNHTNFEDSFGFNFFTFDSNFHSFPSGHSSTIFIVCFILVATFPKLKYFFYFLASVIALSRVVVGAHFFTDIVAGAVLALISFKIINTILEKKYTQYKFSNLLPEDNSEIYSYVLFLLISCVFIASGPSIDLYISGLFYYGDSQFALQSFDLISTLFRDILLSLILIYILIIPIIGRFAKIDKIFFNYRFCIKEIILLWGAQIIGVLIFVNLILKNLWGRARPNDILQLGGKETFSPWYEITKVCESNCSFVSGDASVGFSIIILYLITKKIIFLYASVVAGLVLGLIRIMAGGHFLSDVFFAGFFIVILNIILFALYKKYYAK